MDKKNILKQFVLRKANLIIFIISLFANIITFAQNADITISTGVTSGGSWLLVSGTTWIFTPTSDGATIKTTDITNRLKGTGFTAGNVTINSTCAACTQNGNITISSAINAASAGKTFTITTIGTITVSSQVDLTSSTGNTGGNINFSGDNGITVNATLTATGGAASPAASGKNGGTINLTSSGGVILNANLKSQGTVASAAGSGAGGNGGTITISATSFTSTSSGTFNTTAGNGRGSNGGTGGSISIVSTGVVDITGSFTTNGGTNNTAGSTGSGGAGGSVSISGTSVSITAGGITTTGGTGSGSGGNGGNVTISSSSTSVSITPAITTTGGQTGTSVNGASGGTGGTVNITATTTLSVGNITARGGNNAHFYSCEGNGGNVNLTGTTITNGTITNTKGTNSATGFGSAFCPKTNGTTTTTIIVLPVELTYFTAKEREKEVVLNWETAMEKDNHYFVVEKSINNSLWLGIDTIKGAGDSKISISYEYIDKHGCYATCYYRLRQVDYNGKQETFKSVVVTANQSKKEMNLQVMPNPTKDIVNINLILLQDCDYFVIIYNIEGNNFYSSTKNGAKGLNSVQIDMIKYPSSIYFVNIKTQYGENKTVPIIKQ